MTIQQIIDEQMRELIKTFAFVTSSRFWLMREEDVSGVSGTGVVADGVIFPLGVCVLRWRTAGGSTAVYDSIEILEKIHGHDGKTKIEYLNEGEKLMSFMSAYTRKLIEAVGEEIIGGYEGNEVQDCPHCGMEQGGVRDELRTNQRLKLKEIINSLK